MFRSNDRNLQRINESAGLFECTIDLETNHTAQAQHLRSRNPVVGMRRQARIPHAFDDRLGFEKFGHALAVVVLPCHSQAQRLQSAQQQRRVVRIGHVAQHAQRLPQPRNQIRLADNGAR